MTVFFLDVQQFHQLVSHLAPLDIVLLLNELHNAYDNIVDCFDVYKIETIGDTYMCASGEFCFVSLSVHEFHETCHSVTFYFMKEDAKQCCNATTPESIHTKDESKRGSAFAFIFGVN